MRPTACRIIVTVAFVVVPAAYAAGQPTSEHGWLDLTVGVSQPAEQTFSISARHTSFINGGSLDRTCDYPLSGGRTLDISGGFLIGHLVGAGVGVTVTTYSGTASVSIRATNPFGTPSFGGSDITVDGTVTTESEFQRAEEAVNLSAVFRLPGQGRVQARAFGGPTYVRVRQNTISYASPDYDIQLGDPASPGLGYRVALKGLNSVEMEQLHSSEWGYHAGGSVTVLLTRVFGVGLTVRFMRADVELLSNFALGDGGGPHVVQIRAGGLQVLGGAHLRF